MEIIKNKVYPDACYLELNSKNIKALEKVAIERYIATVGDTEPRDKGQLNFEDTSLHVDEMYYEEGKLNIMGSLFSDGKDLGYFSLYLPLEKGIVLDIIEAYMKKLGKIKTVLEATKNF